MSDYEDNISDIEEEEEELEEPEDEELEELEEPEDEELEEEEEPEEEEPKLDHDMEVISVSKNIDTAMFDCYGDGIFIPHKTLTGRRYRSYPDSEAALASANSTQSNEFLKEFVTLFKSKVISSVNQQIAISSIKITHPYIESGDSEVIPPSPTMKLSELEKYIWPGADLTKMGRDYAGVVWLDLVENSMAISNTKEGGFIVRKEIPLSIVKKHAIRSWPVMVGSNLCNMNIIRSYFGDTTKIKDPDTGLDTTLDKRAHYILDYFKCEPHLPDGYFMLNGDTKACHIWDKLQFNVIYSVESEPGSKSRPSGEKIPFTYGIITEMKSLGKILHNNQMFMSPTGIPRNKNPSYKEFLSIALLLIPKVTGKARVYTIEEKEEEEARPKRRKVREEYPERKPGHIIMGETLPINIFDLANIYLAQIDEKFEKDKGANILLNMIVEMGNRQTDIERVCRLTYGERKNIDRNTNMFDFIQPAVEFNPNEVELEQFTRYKLESLANIFPHCELPLYHKDNATLYDIYLRKMRVVTLMFLNLVLTTTGKIPLSDRKSFIYKRWATISMEMREYLRDAIEKAVLLDNSSKSLDELIAIMRNNRVPDTSSKKIRSRKDTATLGKEGLLESVTIHNLVTLIDAVTSVKVTVSKKAGTNTGLIRRIHPSQWGQQCPANTPENKNVGLHNAMAEACLITTDLRHADYDPIYDILNQYVGKYQGKQRYLLLYDQVPMGYVDPSAYTAFKQAKRSGKISQMISICQYRLYPEVLDMHVIQIRTSHSRAIFPALIIDGKYERIKEIIAVTQSKTYKRKSSGDRFRYLLNNGYIEYIDSAELVADVVVAPWMGSITEKNAYQYTHAMIKPGHIISKASNCISFMLHNPAARGTYAGNHIKQAISRPFKWNKYRYEHDRNELLKPEIPYVMTDTARRLGLDEYGFGANARICARPDYGNMDDGVHISESFAASGRLGGFNYAIFKYPKGISAATLRYNFIYNRESQNFEFPVTIPIGTSGEYVYTKMQIPDVNYVNGIITPYDEPYYFVADRIKKDGKTVYIDPVSKEILPTKQYRLSFLDKKNGAVMHYDWVCELQPGKFYRHFGTRIVREIVYMNTYTMTPDEPVIVEQNERPLNVPGKTIISQKVIRRITMFALVYFDKKYLSEYDTPHKSGKTLKLGIGNSVMQIYGPSLALMVKLVMNPSNNSYIWTDPTNSIAGVIRNRRVIKRGTAALKVIENVANVLHVKDETFEAAYGIVEGIYSENQVKIKTAMPIYPMPGNKYCFLYSQKGVCAKIISDRDMPIARWFNKITGKEEEMHFDVVFNPLSFPSRTTIGMMYEMIIAGTLDYLFHLPFNPTDNIQIPEEIEDEVALATTLYDIYSRDYEEYRLVFDQYMSSIYGVDDASNLVDYLSDTTFGIYDDQVKKQRCGDLRVKIGLPRDEKFDIYQQQDMRDEEGNIILSERVKMKNQIACGTVYYCALRHLVDNKRRASGYVSKKDPLTGQPVKGKSRDGGAKTGTMEVDGYAAHGAITMLSERLKYVSDQKLFWKCIFCSGLLSKKPNSNNFVCNDCKNDVSREDAVIHDSIMGWEILRAYARAAGLEFYEIFDLEYHKTIADELKARKIDHHIQNRCVLILDSKILICPNQRDELDSYQKQEHILAERQEMFQQGYKLICLGDSFMKLGDWRERLQTMLLKASRESIQISDDLLDTALSSLTK